VAKLYPEIAQGTTQWKELRAGIPTASQFHRIVTPKGAPSKSADMYLYELLAERLTGEPTFNATTFHMDRGHDLEAEAIKFYAFTREMETEPVGFVTNDTGTIGASPDQLVGDNGLLEIKVPKPATHVGYLLQSGTAYEEHRTQAQGQLWVAEREWNDLLSYSPAMPPALYRVEREEKHITDIARELTAFSQRLEALYAQLVEQYEWVHQPKPAKTPHETIVELLKDSLREINAK
jgi:hypothetical protein